MLMFKVAEPHDAIEGIADADFVGRASVSLGSSMRTAYCCNGPKGKFLPTLVEPQRAIKADDGLTNLMPAKHGAIPRWII
jgi:hypothetical protein